LEGGLGLEVFRVLGGHISVRLGTNDAAFGGHFRHSGSVGLEGRYAFLVQVGPLLADPAHILGFGLERGVLELRRHLIHLVEIAHQLGDF